jgi:arsenite methyltransferase
MKSEIVNAVEEHYAAVARGETSCCGAPVDTVAKAIGYTEEELAIAGDANLGLGCGNPLALTELKPGMTVLDLGSGAGFDAFLALSRVGPTGRVIGVDMTDDMLALAHQNAEKRGATNVEFRKGYIEKLPVDDASVDYVISNCVINLSADKPAVFREIARVLKPGGHFAVSDIVLLKPLPAVLARDISAYVGCISSPRGSTISPSR